MLNRSLAERLDSLQALDRLTLFFVGGIVKSGTTWIEHILDVHPQVACKGEAYFPRLLQPRLRDAIAQYNAAIGERGNWTRHRREGSDRTPVVRHSYVDDDLQFLMSQAVRIMLARWVGNESIRCVGDKTPDNADFVAQLRQLFPAAKFIYLVRDVRDVVVSAWFFNLAVSGQTFRRTYPAIDAFAQAVSRKWAAQVGEMMSPETQHSPPLCRLKYEDLCHEPVEQADRLFDYLGVDREPRIVRRCVAAADFERLSGGRRRGQENRNAFYRKGVVGDWRNHLDDASLETIEHHCGALMRTLGYTD